jgi:IPT/TIG domain
MGTMRRPLIFGLTLLMLAVPAAGADAAKHKRVKAKAVRKPVITSFSPDQVEVGDTLVLKGRNFVKGTKNNRVYFTRASDPRTVLAKPSKATTTRIEVVVPTKVADFLTTDSSGKKVPTRFRLRVVTKRLGPYTPVSDSPLILAKAVPPAAPTPPAPPADCDKDGVVDGADTDDDNDGLSDETEAAIGTDRCSKDTDGDGNEDAWEYYSALDLNGSALPYPGKRPYPNPLDGSDAVTDYDRDGLTAMQEFLAWATYGNHAFPLNYSEGDQTTGPVSGPAPGLEYMDLDNDGTITDDEKDVDGDGLPNYVETAPNKDSDIFIDFGGGVERATGNTFAAERLVEEYQYLFRLDYLVNDSDGDTVTDGADDNDHDGLSNLEEITSGVDTLYTDPLDPCDPVASPFCPQH